MTTAATLHEIAAFMDAHPDVQLSMVNPILETATFRADTITAFNTTSDAIRDWFGVGKPTYRDHNDYEIATWTTPVGGVWLYGRKDMPMTED